VSERVDAILQTLQAKLTQQELDDLAQALTEAGAVEVRPAGDWCVIVDERNLARGKDEMSKVQFEHWEDEKEEIDLTVTVFHGPDDGRPVIQIDGEARFRVNVNDAPIWDGDPEHQHLMCQCVNGDS
jgi:hypothetical protein